jgi:hypothetical protein
MRRQTMSKRDFIRSLLAVVLILGLGLAPVVAQAAPNLAGDSRDGSIWDVFAPVLQLWEAFWGHSERGPGVDPTNKSFQIGGLSVSSDASKNSPTPSSQTSRAWSRVRVSR